MNRNQRLEIAQETLAILERGSYLAPSGRSVSVTDALQAAVAGSVLYRPDDPPLIPAQAGLFTTRVEVTGETTLEAAERLAEHHPLCLNFASAKNPGGGFLSGSQAQEESLARSSGLYATLVPMTGMYEYNRSLGTSLYSDYMVYSPNVPVFRTDDGTLRETPFLASFITAPAVNAGAVEKNEPQNVRFILPTMTTRLHKLLSVAQTHGHTTLILGAWGCGVFGNSPAVIARLFADAFGPDGGFHGVFKRVIYAVYDSSPSQETLAAFQFLV
jgi:uncharacterized protein (TIGR02452 family)